MELDIPDELAARILDISGGRLINGVWEPVITQEERSQPFGATVEEFENAINYEVVSSRPRSTRARTRSRRTRARSSCVS